MTANQEQAAVRFNGWISRDAANGRMGESQSSLFREKQRSVDPSVWCALTGDLRILNP